VGTDANELPQRAVFLHILEYEDLAVGLIAVVVATTFDHDGGYKASWSREVNDINSPKRTDFMARISLPDTRPTGG